jgi:hypothetical protein
MGRVDRDAMMQQLQAQLESATGQLESETAQQPGPIRHFFAVLATGLTFLVVYVVVTMRARKTGRVYGIPTNHSAAAAPWTPPSVDALPRHISQPRMAEQWSDEDDKEMWSAMRREHDSTRHAVRSGSADSVLSQAQTVYVVIFNEGTEREGVYTLQSKGDGRPHLLTFESTDDADRFVELLQGQGLNEMGKPLMWEAGMAREFCDSCEYAVMLVPTGTVFMPPRSNCVDEEAFRVREELRQFEAADGQTIVENATLGLDTYTSEREMLERLWGGFAP